GLGRDIMFGNLGADILTGGTDEHADQFSYFTGFDSGVGAGNRDIITDFQTGLDLISFKHLRNDAIQGNNKLSFIADAAFSNTAGEIRYQNVDTDTIVQIDFDGDAVVDFEIELTGNMTLAANDFMF
ncbi:MAG: M10 family metallopeptidase C-terminal domain-containing protein, partial [Alphaproteobacteria bacterium]|nr:M10 family metallopeptidase C-terminal domain-containing protein [Alphaproteobacteria bacterium]MCR9140422.1 M10 family metallopeptidase C-terminal domain-containing protein [Alphaproteobacteria bacterium]